MSDGGDAARDALLEIGGNVRDTYGRTRRVMAFDELYALARAEPRRFLRSSAQYAKDCFDHFGTTEVRTPRGMVTRWKLFDLAFDEGRDRLIGQEDIQAELYRILGNFVRGGQTNKLVLLHGPNGSAKSTTCACIARGLEHYSGLDEGIAYRFNWIFPSQKITKSGIGFSGHTSGASGGISAEVSPQQSFAYLDDDMIDARLVDELRDNPLYLLPREERAKLAKLAQQKDPTFVVPDALLHGELNHKNKQIFEALLLAYKGDYLKVLRHVQVERFYLARRYREGLVTVEPQLAVDAQSRQITMDRSLQALPPALQSLSMHEYQGELVDANRGMIEYADLLKRPLEAYKYLLNTVEQAEVNVGPTILFLDTLFLASSNESHLAVFKEVPEFQSFKGRLELVRAPYVLDYKVEQAIYDQAVTPAAVGRHVAPHATHVAALWAVLTRMRRPIPDRYGKSLSEVVGKLSPMDKAELYARGKLPEGVTPEQGRELEGNLDKIYGESDSYPNYEGRTGASPREMKTLLFNAAQNTRYRCLSPLGVFDELEELVKHVTVYEFLKQEPLPGGYHENKRFIGLVRDRYVEIVDEEARTAMGLVDEKEYSGLLGRYVTNVSHWSKKEKLRNAATGRLEEPDQELMADVEKTLGVTDKPEQHRHDLISRIGAWSIEHPGKKLDYAEVFPRQLQQLREAYFADRKKIVKKTQEDLLLFLNEGEARAQAQLTPEAFVRVKTTFENLRDRHGYNVDSARDAIGFLLRRRYS
ncbi:MAG: serine protein kinase PrkA [Polyangia bacterium]